MEQFASQYPMVRGISNYQLMYLLVIVSAVLCMAASAAVSSTYKKYAQVRSRSGLTGAETARRILEANGVSDVQIAQVAGSLTDHYDPASKTVRLSQATYNSSSVAAVGVAAHLAHQPLLAKRVDDALGVDAADCADALTGDGLVVCDHGKRLECRLAQVTRVP